MKTKLNESAKHKREAQEARKALSLPGTTNLVDLQLLAIYNEDTANVLDHDFADPQIVAGEVVLSEADRPDAAGGFALRNTLAGPDTAAIVASMERTELLTQGGTDVLAMGIDAAASIPEATSLEKMLAHQLALTHQMAFKLMERAMMERDSVETARLVNASARMMTTYQQGLLTINRLRTGGRQVVTVQHVNVGNGGQAVVTGSLQPGGTAQQIPGG